MKSHPNGFPADTEACLSTAYFLQSFQLKAGASFSRIAMIRMAKLNLDPAEIRVLYNFFENIEAPEKKITSRWGGGLPSCLGIFFNVGLGA